MKFYLTRREISRLQSECPQIQNFGCERGIVMERIEHCAAATFLWLKRVSPKSGSLRPCADSHGKRWRPPFPELRSSSDACIVETARREHHHR